MLEIVVPACKLRRGFSGRTHWSGVHVTARSNRLLHGCSNLMEMLIPTSTNLPPKAEFVERQPAPKNRSDVDEAAAAAEKPGRKNRRLEAQNEVDEFSSVLGVLMSANTAAETSVTVADGSVSENDPSIVDATINLKNSNASAVFDPAALETSQSSTSATMNAELNSVSTQSSALAALPTDQSSQTEVLSEMQRSLIAQQQTESAESGSALDTQPAGAQLSVVSSSNQIASNQIASNPSVLGAELPAGPNAVSAMQSDSAEFGRGLDAESIPVIEQNGLDAQTQLNSGESVTTFISQSPLTSANTELSSQPTAISQDAKVQSSQASTADSRRPRPSSSRSNAPATVVDSAQTELRDSGDFASTLEIPASGPGERPPLRSSELLESQKFNTTLQQFWSQHLTESSNTLSRPRGIDGGDKEIASVSSHSSTRPESTGPLLSGQLASTGPSDFGATISAEVRQPLSTQVSQVIIEHIERNGAAEAETMTVRLDPPELGELVIELSKTKEGLAVRVTARESVTMDMLLARGNEIESQLRGDSMDLKSLEFLSPGMMSNGSFDGRPSREQFQTNDGIQGSSRGTNRNVARNGTTPDPQKSIVDSPHVINFRA